MRTIHIEPITIGRLTILDPRDCTVEQQGAVANATSKALDQWIAAVNNPVDFGPGLFCESAKRADLPDPPFDDTLPVMRMNILRDGIGHGSFTITNMVLETENKRKIEATGFGIYLTDRATPRGMLQESARVCSVFLDKNIRLKSGKILDIVAWDLRHFPRKLRTRRVVDLMEWFETSKKIGVRHPRLDPDERIPRRIRRSDAPRQEATDDEVLRDTTLPPRDDTPALTEVTVEIIVKVPK